jgi:hypothetical protein
MTMVVGSFDDEQMPRAKSIIGCCDSGVVSCPVLEILMPTRCSTIRGWRLHHPVAVGLLRLPTIPYTSIEIPK